MIGWPVYFGLAAFSSEVIAVLYGPKWLAAAPAASILAAGFAARLLTVLSSAGLSAIGRPYLAGQASALDLVVRLLAVAISGVNELWQFALAIALADTLTTAYPIWQMRRHLGLHLRELARALRQTAMACLLPCGVVLALRFLLPATWPDALKLLVVLSLGAAGWLAGMRWVAHPLLAELQTLCRKLLPSSAQRWSSAVLGVGP
jgi:O-antigen/teichoic acid export membrane protein